MLSAIAAESCSLAARPRQAVAHVALRGSTVPARAAFKPARQRGLCCRADGERAENGGSSSASSRFLRGSGGGALAEESWSRATVVENREASADGSVRTLVLSIEDHVTFLDGRKVRHVQEAPRWIDGYTRPGQLVAVRFCASEGSTSVDECGAVEQGPRPMALASSPYEARQDSANLDASIIELLVKRGGGENGGGEVAADEQQMAALGPGSLIEVSPVLGRGYASLFNSHISLLSVLKEARPLLMVAVGVAGIAPLRAALSWTPVLAHATTQTVSLFYVADSPSSACFLVEWDSWREAGVRVHPLYLESNGGGWNPGRRAPEVLLEEALFHGDHGLSGSLGGDPREAAVLMSGLAGDAAAHLTRKLTQAGVASERLLFCDVL